MDERNKKYDKLINVGQAYKQKQPSEVFYKKSFLRNFTKSTGKHLRQCHFLNKVADLRPATLFTKETLAQVFSCEFLRAPFLQKTSGQLLLYEALTSKFISAILGFHTFTGCDITGNIYGKSKLSC